MKLTLDITLTFDLMKKSKNRSEALLIIFLNLILDMIVRHHPSYLTKKNWHKSSEFFFQTSLNFRKLFRDFQKLQTVQSILSE